MAYVELATVQSIVGLEFGSDVNAALVVSAERHIEDLVGYDMDGGVQIDTQHFDVLRRNEYSQNYDGEPEFVLRFKPLVSVNSVTSDPDGSANILAVNDDYIVKSDIGSIMFLDGYEPVVGLRKLKVVYTYGYATVVPSLVIEYANWYCAYLHDVVKLGGKNSDGNILEEIEIGRYREKYNTGSMLRSKYDMLPRMKKEIETKYKNWY